MTTTRILSIGAALAVGTVLAGSALAQAQNDSTPQAADSAEAVAVGQLTEPEDSPVVVTVVKQVKVHQHHHGATPTSTRTSDDAADGTHHGRGNGDDDAADEPEDGTHHGDDGDDDADENESGDHHGDDGDDDADENESGDHHGDDGDDIDDEPGHD